MAWVIPSPNPYRASDPSGSVHPGRAGQNCCNPPAQALPTFSLGRWVFSGWVLKTITGKGTPRSSSRATRVPQPPLCWGDLQERFRRSSCVPAC